ncbi:uncharacterized protein LOC129720318 [Wyeomyia smithii]|uniref:uncharacterized protein LOC129720318 n=1 Tax=Wyeomyia smithii TaxID=174621 RepID=UPI00246807C4|nr:uncharacterized protein LOC129720318 [Wyeomyia smithii]
MLAKVFLLVLAVQQQQLSHALEDTIQVARIASRKRNVWAAQQKLTQRVRHLHQTVIADRVLQRLILHQAAKLQKSNALEKENTQNWISQSIIMLAKVFLLVLAVQVCRAQPAEVPGTLQTSSSLFLPVATAAFTCTGGYDSGCKDCFTQTQCMGSAAKIDSACPASAPNCYSGSCSTTIDTASSCKVAKIKCTGEGEYPDPNTCQAYHYSTLLCRKSSNSADCVSIKCPAATGLVAFGTSKTYYALCLYTNNALSQVLMLKCSTGATFDGKTCVYRCSREGNFVDSNNSAKYYQCYILNGKWTYDNLACPDGKKFNATQQICL